MMDYSEKEEHTYDDTFKAQTKNVMVSLLLANIELCTVEGNGPA